MCNHYRNLPSAIEDWAIWAGYKPRLPDVPVQEELWPKSLGYVVRREGGVLIVDAMKWGVPMQVKGERPADREADDECPHVRLAVLEADARQSEPPLPGALRRVRRA